MSGINNKAMEQEIIEQIKKAQSVDELKSILTENGLNADEVISAAEAMNQKKAEGQELDDAELEHVAGGFGLLTAVATVLLVAGISLVSAGIYGMTKEKTVTEVCTKDDNGEWSNCTTTYK